MANQLLQVRSRARTVMDAASSTAANRRRPSTIKPGSKRDPTNANDLRTRLQTQLRRALNDWRQRAYEAIVKSDVLGYDIGEVDQTVLNELVFTLNSILRRQAFVAMSPAHDSLAVTLRTAYARGVNTAILEVGTGVPFGVSDQVINQAFQELATILDSQVNVALAKLVEEPERPTRSRWLLWSAVLLPFLFRALNRRINALATTNVTRAYNAGKLDTYEISNIRHVGVEAETQPSPRSRRKSHVLRELGEEGIHEAAEHILPAVRAINILALTPSRREAPGEASVLPGSPVAPRTPTPPGKPPRPAVRLPPRWEGLYTVQTMGDDKVCKICHGYEGRSFTLAQARRLIPAHPHCRCSVVLL